ncbi:hypothetical protein BN1200_1000002 [Klebsiella variicola]|nr:hypothetical protein BN1200_1000002 [Klebsiella variicola]
MASRRAIGHWLTLLLLSVLFSSLLLRLHLPAALLLGPLIAGLILSLRGVKLSIPRPWLSGGAGHRRLHDRPGD